MEGRIIKIIDRQQAHGLEYVITETKYDYGTHHCVLFINGQPSFRSTDLACVQKYMESKKDPVPAWVETWTERRDQLKKQMKEDRT